jgi:hypothetical protein
VRLDQPTVRPVVNQFLVFYETHTVHRYVYMRAPLLFIFWARSIQYTLFHHLFNIHFNIILQSESKFSKNLFPHLFLSKTKYVPTCISLLPIRATWPAHLIIFKKIEHNVLSVCHNYILVYLFQMLVTRFGLNRQSSDQYLWKLTNAGAYNITGQPHGIPCHWRVILCGREFLSFYKHWPDDGLFRPKLVANI